MRVDVRAVGEEPAEGLRMDLWDDRCVCASGGGDVRQADVPWRCVGDWGTGSDVIDSIPGIPGISISRNPIPGMPILAWIHYNLSYMKY